MRPSTRPCAPGLRAPLALLLAAALAGCGGGGGMSSGGGGGGGCGGYNQPACGGGGGMQFGGAGGGQYIANVLVSDTGMGALHADARLVNAWGLAFNPSGYAWVADALTASSTLYDGDGVAQTTVVSMPAGALGAGFPTGLVFNGTGGFAFSANGTQASAVFLFATLQGQIAAWSPAVDATHAFSLVDNGAAGASYTGLALGMSGTGASRLYAANFAQARVDVYDSSFAAVATAGGFIDASLPAAYAPFGIQQVNGRILVAYAEVDPASGRALAGAGLGALDAFDGDGNLVSRLVAPGGALNAPWGMALAPANFGPQSGRLLVGNFGDGTIHAFDPSTGALAGQLLNDNGSAIVIEGLWGIAFGNGLFQQPATTLFYAAGPGAEQHGQYGRIDLN